MSAEVGATRYVDACIGKQVEIEIVTFKSLVYGIGKSLGKTDTKTAGVGTGA